MKGEVEEEDNIIITVIIGNVFGYVNNSMCCYACHVLIFDPLRRSEKGNRMSRTD